MKAILLQPNGKPTGRTTEVRSRSIKTIYDRDQIYRQVKVKRQGLFRQLVGYYKLSE